jgi:hypothetical protein
MICDNLREKERTAVCRFALGLPLLHPFVVQSATQYQVWKKGQWMG